jgi:hypothetical protein
VAWVREPHSQLSFEVSAGPRRWARRAPLPRWSKALRWCLERGVCAGGGAELTHLMGKGVRDGSPNVNNDAGPARPSPFGAGEQWLATCRAARPVSLVVSWFGDDLRLDHCDFRPKSRANRHSTGARWRGRSLVLSAAPPDSWKLASRPRFGGTPADASVVQAIQRMRASGTAVMFYPFSS